MPKSRCQQPNAKECKHDLSSNQHSEKVMEYEKNLRRKVNMLQCPSSLKQMNFKTECFSSLLLTINTEVIIFNIRLSTITKFNHEIHEQWHFAPMLVYVSSFLGAFDYNSRWNKLWRMVSRKFGSLWTKNQSNLNMRFYLLTYDIHYCFYMLLLESGSVNLN